MIPTRTKLPPERNSITHSISIGAGEDAARAHITVGLYPSGAPGEIFIKAGKVGSTAHAYLDAMARQMSIGLQYGIPLEILVGQMTGVQSGDGGVTDNKSIPMAGGLVDYVGKWMMERFGSPGTTKEKSE